jgi:uncharacterized membrane protein
MTEMPYWALATIYWLHMLATVVWLGGLATLSLIVIPASAKVLETAQRIALLDAIQKRLEPVAWFCLFLLILTGMFQLGANENYESVFSTANNWSSAILVKHLLVVGMIVASSIQTWEIMPSIRRALIRYQNNPEASQLEKLRKRESQLLQINIWLSALVLLATAFARAA